MRLGDLDALKTKIEINFSRKPEAQAIYKHLIDIIEDAPTVENITIFAELGKDMADITREIMPQLLAKVRPQGEWGKWVISEIRCPNCLEYFDVDCYSKEELRTCPNCGADMRKVCNE